MKELYCLIHCWVLGLIKHNPSHHIIHSSFDIEDGMTLDKYIEYEQFQFSSLSSIYDLNENFSIKIIAEKTINDIENVKKIVYFYIINSLDKIVCKMNITVIKEEDLFFIGSNNFSSQLVPKYSLLYKDGSINISHISLAIKTDLKINNIISTYFELASLSEGDNYSNDLFYHAKFIVEDAENTFNHFSKFYLHFNNDHKEKREIFFDEVNVQLKPFFIKDNHLSLVNDLYPVHLSYWKNSINYNVEYPRNVTINLDAVTSITVTDSLDNDWNIVL